MPSLSFVKHVSFPWLIWSHFISPGFSSLVIISLSSSPISFLPYASLLLEFCTLHSCFGCFPNFYFSSQLCLPKFLLTSLPPLSIPSLEPLLESMLRIVNYPEKRKAEKCQLLSVYCLSRQDTGR